MKRIIRVFLGTSVVVLVVETIRREISQFTHEAKNGFLVKDQMADFWFWLSNVSMEYAGLHAYARDRRTFKNVVWEDGIKEHINSTQQFFDHFPAVLQDQNDIFSVSVGRLKTQAEEQLNCFRESYIQSNRQGMTKSSEKLGNILEEIHKVGTKRRLERMLRDI